ncbi:hypothetical protein [Lysobacter enzymogenes]|uniref:hypothetical protein n=1 Tax=Lysobacter enzymogenes TaxID=69 RepID=UPI001A95BB2F|nr:hypothetical protein [Lysobacter enzymogenes]QQP97553.1 hypothetical protein JHW38_05905 [Lysobacter enzymogenes]
MDSFFLFAIVSKALLALALWAVVQYAALGPANRRRVQPLSNGRLFARALLGAGVGVLAGAACLALAGAVILSIGGELTDAGFFLILLSLPVGLAVAVLCGFKLARRWVLRAQPGAAPAPQAEPVADDPGEA